MRNRRRVVASAVESLEIRRMFALLGPDVNFGVAGTVQVDGRLDLQELQNGKIQAIGREEEPIDPDETDPSHIFDTVISRLNADGTLDTSFGTGGKVNLGSADHAAFGDSRLFTDA